MYNKKNAVKFSFDTTPKSPQSKLANQNKQCIAHLSLQSLSKLPPSSHGGPRISSLPAIRMNLREIAMGKSWKTTWQVEEARG